MPSSKVPVASENQELALYCFPESKGPLPDNSDDKICFSLYCAKHAANERNAHTMQAEEYSRGAGI